MKKTVNLHFIALSVVALVVAITAISAVGYNTEADIEQLASRPMVTIEPAQGVVAGLATENAHLVIDRGTGNSLSMYVQVNDETTVFQALQEAANDYGLELKTSTSDYGVLVQGIGEMIGGQDDKYWIYYVNGEMALNSVDKQMVNPGDKIEFRFEANPF
ncbi:MAG: DUF4430 domain-containing protein [Patescibacteria group bacterium]|jgi:hypothetical protein